MLKQFEASFGICRAALEISQAIAYKLEMMRCFCPRRSLWTWVTLKSSLVTIYCCQPAHNFIRSFHGSQRLLNSIPRDRNFVWASSFFCDLGRSRYVKLAPSEASLHVMTDIFHLKSPAHRLWHAPLLLSGAKLMLTD